MWLITGAGVKPYILIYHVLVYKALKRAERSYQEDDGSYKAEMFLVPVSLEGTASLVSLKSHEMQLKKM